MSPSAGSGPDTATLIALATLLLMAVTVAAGVVGAAMEWAAHFARAARRDAGRCEGCGYDLTGLASSRCPECGRAISVP
jgi:hypothetical protein